MTEQQLKLNARNNCIFIRKQLLFTQSQLAIKLNIKRAALGSYEEGRAFNVGYVFNMAEIAKVSLDTIYKTDMRPPKEEKKSAKKKLSEIGLEIGK